MLQETAPDPAVGRLLSASSEAQAREQLELLLSGTVRPTIEKIVRHELVGGTGSAAILADDIEDVTATAIAAVIRKLQELRSDESAGSIGDLKGYSARCAYNACGMHFRAKFPVRARVAAQVRAVLRANDALAAWSGTDGRMVAGRTAWQTRVPEKSAAKERMLQERPGEVATSLKIEKDAKTIDIVVTALDWAGGPIALSSLIFIVMEARGERDVVRANESVGDEDADPIVERQASSHTSADQVVALRDYLLRIWVEIGLLPSRQAQALLLNFRDSRGNGMLELLILASVTTVAALAGVLGWSEDQLREAWPDLPWDDARVAEYLGATTMDVSNLRSVARRRIERRMKSEED